MAGLSSKPEASDAREVCVVSSEYDLSSPLMKSDQEQRQVRIF
jgi:hypothetical protein